MTPDEMIARVRAVRAFLADASEAAALGGIGPEAASLYDTIDAAVDELDLILADHDERAHANAQAAALTISAHTRAAAELAAEALAAALAHSPPADAAFGLTIRIPQERAR